ncbi:MAG: hypothetical protein ACI88A_000546 [Paraglaciecola sp.]|jgi:hypothetical protein
MNKLTKLTIALAACSVMATASAETLISSWGYINEAGFTNATTGEAVVVGTANNGADIRSTLDPDTLLPLDSTGEVAPTNGNNWVQNSNDGLFYDLGSAGSVGGDSSVSPTTGTIGEGSGSILSTGSLNDEICWGGGPSCLSFTDANDVDTSRVEGTATTGGGFNQGTQLTHNNAPTGAPSLTSIQIVDGLFLYSDDITSPGGLFEVPELLIDVIFNETFGNAGPFFDYAPDDAFIVFLDAASNPGSTISFGAGFVDFTVQMDLTGQVAAGFHTSYEVVTRLSGLEVVSIPAALGGGAFGIITPEGMINTLNAQFLIRAVGIPEPGSLAIFGMVLLGLAGSRKFVK